MMESLPVEMCREIMKHLSNAELVKISLVSKLFNFEARSLMRDRGTLNAMLTKSCVDVVPFVQDLENINVVPWSGLSFGLSCHYQSCRRQSLSNGRKSEPKFLAILARLPWKRLSVGLAGSIDAPKRCPAAQLLRKIIRNFSPLLEQISVDDNYRLVNFIQGASYDGGFPRLKVLKMYGWRSRETDTYFDQDDFIKEMVWRAPNLRELHLSRMLDFSEENILDGTSAALVLSSWCECNPLTCEFPESVAGNVRLKKLKLEYQVPNLSAPFTVAKFNRIVPLILQASFSTLKTLSVDAVFMLPFMCYGIAFENVTDLTISMDCLHLARSQPQIITLLKRFDFTRVFPRLSQVVIAHGLEQISQNQINQLVEQGSAALFQDLQPNRAANIKSLRYYNSCLHATAPFLAEMLPSIEKLETIVREGREVPYQMIWEHWSNLKELEIEHCGRDHYTPWDINLDSVFCGIFPQELAQLGQQDDEYLKAVNIVPVMPSIGSFQALRTLKLIYYDDKRNFRGQEKKIPSPSNLICSKVTGLIAFQRCPNLSVTIQTNLYGISEALSYMKPYASIDSPRYIQQARMKVLVRRPCNSL